MFEDRRDRKCLDCCADCKIIISSFCEVYHELKCLELQLKWRLETLVSIMKLANRVPSRLKQLKRILREPENNSESVRDAEEEEQKTEAGEQEQALIKSLKVFRQDVIRKCTKKLSNSAPRVLVRNHGESLDADVSQTQLTPLPIATSVHVEGFIGWITSFAAIVLLTLCTFQNEKPKEISLTGHQKFDIDMDCNDTDDGGILSFDEIENEDADATCEENSSLNTDNHGVEHQELMTRENAGRNWISTEDSHCYDLDNAVGEHDDVENDISSELVGNGMDNDLPKTEVGSGNENEASKQEANSNISIHIKMEIGADEDDYVAPLEGESLTQIISGESQVDVAPDCVDETMVEPNETENILPVVAAVASKDMNTPTQLTTPPTPSLPAEKYEPIRNPSSSNKLTDTSTSSSSSSKKTEKENSFRCDICEVSFKSPYSLRTHNNSKRHKLSLKFHKRPYVTVKTEETNSTVDPKFAFDKPQRSIKEESTSDSETETDDDGNAPRRYSLRKRRKCSYQDANDIKEKENNDSESFSDCSPSDGKEHAPSVVSSVDMDLDKEDISEEETVSGIKYKRRIKCKLCSKRFTNIGKFVTHHKAFHTKVSTPTTDKKGKFICPVVHCSEKFRTAQNLENHRKLHGSFKCYFCNVVKDYAPDSAIHEMEHVQRDEEEETSGEKREYLAHNCARCSFGSVKKFPYIRHHLETHLNLTATTLTCEICKMEGTDSKFLKGHFKVQHKIDGIDPSKILRCDLCPAYFIKKTQLIRHKSRIHFKNKTCSECGKVFPKPKSLRFHMELVHSIRPSADKFSCDFTNCKKVFSLAALLNSHKKSAHDYGIGVELIKCSKCDKKFKGNQRLKAHMLTVHSERSLVCAECGKAFKSKNYLDRHMEYHKGPDAWKHQCSTCGRKFADKAKLEMHQRTHTKETPYVCQYCGGKYAHRHNWRNHIKTKHAKEYEEEEGATKGHEPMNYLSRKGSKKGDCIIAGTRKN